MFTLRLYTYGWLILKDGEDHIWGFGGKEIALAVASVNSIDLTFENCELKKVA